jgi:hypothetical protein
MKMPSDLHSSIDFAAFGQDALAVVYLFFASWQNTRSNPTILQIGIFPRLKCALMLADPAAIKVRLFYLHFSHMPSTTVCRRLLPLALDFQSQCIGIDHCPFLDRTSWLQRERNGKSIERLPHQHFQRYPLLTVHRLYLNVIRREITNWYGTRLSGS